MSLNAPIGAVSNDTVAGNASAKATGAPRQDGRSEGEDLAAPDGIDRQLFSSFLDSIRSLDRDVRQVRSVAGEPSPAHAPEAPEATLRVNPDRIVGATLVLEP